MVGGEKGFPFLTEKRYERREFSYKLKKDKECRLINRR